MVFPFVPFTEVSKAVDKLFEQVQTSMKYCAPSMKFWYNTGVE